MNKSNLKSSILLFLIFLTLFAPFISLTTELFKNPEVNAIRTAGSWTISPILIDGYDPSGDWAYHAATYPWCFGSGTENDPYIIENVTIQGTGVENLITIEDAEDYFIIRNCKLYEGQIGIYLDAFSVANGKIINNNISLNTMHGIGAYYAENISIIDNSIQNNGHTGIYTEAVPDLLILGNTITHNNESGIFLLRSGSSEVVNNNVSANNAKGLWLSNSGFCEIKHNQFEYNGEPGIYLSGDYNNVTNNTIKHNNIGVDLDVGHHNIIFKNTIEENAVMGVYLDAGLNTITDNSILNNFGNGIKINSWDNNITNNDLKFNSNGIHIQGGRNKVEGNNIEANSNNGILMENANNNTIVQNLIRQNLNFGIWVGYQSSSSNYNLISRNLIAENSLDGVFSDGCHSNTYLENNISNHTTHHGINFHDVEDTIVRGNRFYNNLNGIRGVLFHDNIIEKNNFTENNDNGVYLESYCQRNIFSENEFNNNFYTGINIDRDYDWWNPLAYTSGSNLIYNNSFRGNLLHAFSNSTYDYWNSSTIGNYWDDFLTGVDVNDNGISEIPYNVSIIPFTQDHLPIYDDGDDPAPPIISIISPIDYQVMGISSPSFQISISGLHVNTTWYELSGGSTNYTFSGNSGKIDQGLWDEFGNGTVTIRFYVNDSLGYGTSEDITIRKDINQPNLVINTPISDTLYDNIAPIFNVELSDPNLDTSWYSIDGGLTNIIFTTNSSINQTLWESTLDGQVEITFNVNDTAGNLIFDSVTVKKDTHAPVITIISPNSYDLFGNSTINFNVEIFDLNLEKMWYTISGSLTNISFTSNGMIDASLWNSFGSGDLTLVFYANDTNGRISTNNVIISKDIDPPSISIINPTSGEAFYVTPPEFEITVNDAHLELVWYTIDGGLTNTNVTQNTDFIDQSVWDAASQGDVTLRFYARDSLGNTRLAEIIIKKASVTQQQPPPEIPGFNIYLIMILSAGIIALLVKKYNKNL